MGRGKKERATGNQNFGEGESDEERVVRHREARIALNPWNTILACLADWTQKKNFDVQQGADIQLSEVWWASGNSFFPTPGRRFGCGGLRERQTPIVANAGRACTHHIAQLCKRSGNIGVGSFEWVGGCRAFPTFRTPMIFLMRVCN